MDLFLVVNRVDGAESKPNVIYIMADELGYFEPAFMGNPNLINPNNLAKWRPRA